MQTEQISKLLSKLLIKAGKIICDAHKHYDEGAITQKAGCANFVTVYDVKVQDFLIASIKKAIPNATFIAEEQENHSSALQADCCFVIDPIDGTTNFMYDMHHSCISVAVFSHGEPVLGVVYDPYLKEYFHAQKGKGAYLGSKKLNVNDHTLESALVSFGTSPYYRDTLADTTFELAKKLFLIGADIRRCGSAALDLAYLAAGRYDVFFETRLSPWDFAAGYLLITEAGGTISTLDGSKIDFSKPHSILASNKAAYHDLLQIAKDYSID